MTTLKAIVVLAVAVALSSASLQLPKREETYKIIENFAQSFRDKSVHKRPEISSKTLVTTKYGQMQGSEARVTGGALTDKFYSYTNIPYAVPPVGELRFQPPQPFTEGWGDEVYDATGKPPACAQFLTHVQPAKEDCLYLNVYTNRPADSADKTLRPVVVFVHGGAFILGETSYYGGSRWTIEDVILVVPAYRLSVFGFFSTGDEVVPGNNGMKDVVQALKWVQENIEAFGGDPNQVTIAGESAGAAISSYILLSPMAQGLFHKVVALSGAAISEWAIDRTPRQSANRLATALNCSIDSSAEMVNCMKQVSMQDLSRVGFETLLEHAVETFRMELPGVVPVIEAAGPSAFISEDPLITLQEGNIPDVPILMGSVQHEGVLPLATFLYVAMQPWGLINDEHWVHHDMIPQLMGVYGVDDHINGASVSQSLALAYLPHNPRNNFTEVVHGMLDMMSVGFMKAPILRTVEILAERKKNVFLYSFEHYSRNSYWNFLFPVINTVYGGKAYRFKTGIMHADDMIYTFTSPFIFSNDDRTVSRAYLKLLANFATTGNPTPTVTSQFPQWPVYSLETRQYLKIDANPTIMTDYADSWVQGVPA